MKIIDNKIKTRCNKGHAFTSENTIQLVRGNGESERVCRICKSDAMKRYSKTHPRIRKKKEKIYFDHSLWNKNKVGYGATHYWLKKCYGAASRCENLDCIYPKTTKTRGLILKPKRFEWANISGEYLREKSDWVQLCALCHRRMDHGLITINLLQEISKEK